MKHSVRDNKGRFTRKTDAETATSNPKKYHNVRDKNGKFVSKVKGGSPKTKKVATKKTKVTNTIDILILDASTSMGQHYNNTVEGVNKYLDTIAESQKVGISAMINVMQFSGYNRGNPTNFRWIYRNVESTKMPKLDRTNYTTGGWTPLYDAIMEGTNGVVELKKLSPDTQVTVTIFTDGEENQSNATADVVRNRVKELMDAGVTVTYMGAGNGYSVKATAVALGIEVSNTLAYEDTTSGRITAYYSLVSARSVQTTNYSKGITSNIGFFSQD